MSAFLRGIVKDISPQEIIVFSYWSTIISLVTQGIPYDVIQTLSEGELAVILGTLGAINEKESQDQARMMQR